MNLNDVNVLVDGYNLQLIQGTGIKTYGISLIQTLKQLGAGVDILFSREISNTNNPTLDEILFFDVLTEEPGLLQRFSAFKAAKWFTNAALTAGGIPRKAMPINTKGIVVKSPVNSSFINSVASFIDSVEVFNLAGCYQNSNSLFKFLELSSSVSIPKKVDIFHATYPLPVRVKGTKKITTIHDLIPLRLPYTTLDNKKMFYKLIQDAIKHSDMIATVSENSKHDILSIFDVDPDKVRVTYQPIALRPFSQEEDQVLPEYLKKFKLKPKDYILFVGAIEPKKNVGRLIDAFSGIDTKIPLVIVGKRGWLWANEIGKVDAIFGQRQAQRKVKLLEYVSSEDLRYLYSGATCFVFPSLYEGFGLPPLEAMSFGCPVITSNASSLPEICGDAALYVDPYDMRNMRETLEKLLQDEALQLSLSSAGKERAQHFSQENYSKRLLDVYSQCL
ncbi:MAG TPA: glycosyltransferase family 4 protein [Elainellaceae cyanobacterium]